MQVVSNWPATYSNFNWQESSSSQIDSSSAEDKDEGLTLDVFTENKKDDNMLPKSVDELNDKEKSLLFELQTIDTKVRAHESAHLSAAAGIAVGGANFTYERGPDGRMYATAGEVPISVSEGKDPQDTIAKMRQVQIAAMAPADPSPQDYAVAAKARIGELKALMELQKEKNEIKKEEGLKEYGSIADSHSTTKFDDELSTIA